MEKLIKRSRIRLYAGRIYYTFKRYSYWYLSKTNFAKNLDYKPLPIEINDTHLIGKWRSDEPVNEKYEVFEKDHEIRSEWFGGHSRNNKIFRKIIDIKTGKEKGEEFITENHAIMMYNPLLEYNDEKNHPSSSRKHNHPRQRSLCKKVV